MQTLMSAFNLYDDVDKKTQKEVEIRNISLNEMQSYLDDAIKQVHYMSPTSQNDQ